MVVVGLGYDFLFNFLLAHCAGGIEFAAFYTYFSQFRSAVLWWLVEIACCDFIGFEKCRISRLGVPSPWLRILMSLVSHQKSYLVCDELLNFGILHNIYLFSSSCLCPVGCLSFVRWKKIKISITEYSKIRQFDTYLKAFLMRNQGHKFWTKSAYCAAIKEE